ncbi:hypothetical protein BBW65_01410 [Helicobacter enhydrae]|uniref:ComEC/Rec2-related protein domain-containing protein n=1 Tax=Helicobacter enhydrae TaxID=222136 RepID=A0A1B1U7G1_9HELI|nr:hypothetical protein BBW65_01410 [Helicobacter enhydrae]
MLDTPKEWGGFGLILLCVALLFWGMRYTQYQSYITQDKQTISALVLAQYPKKDYWVLKLKTDSSQILYTTSKEHLKNLQNRHITIFGKPTKCSFIQSLKSCFFVTFSITLEPQGSSVRHYLSSWIASQHQEAIYAELYETLFLAFHLPKEWRDLASKLQISHLIAISGLHLGILLGVFVGIVGVPYRFLQQRYFTYRHRHFDLSFLGLLLLLGYLVVIDFQPSFLRAFAMSALAIFLLYYNLRILEYRFLFVCMAILLALFPFLAVSIGFWFSCAGVFLIIGIVRYFHLNRLGKLAQIVIYVLFFNAYLFLSMLPLSLFVFPIFSPWSILSIPLSIVFPAFFVLALFLHILGIGGVLDWGLEWMYQIVLDGSGVELPDWIFGIYLICFFASIRFAVAFWALPGLGLALWLYLSLEKLS